MSITSIWSRYPIPKGLRFLRWIGGSVDRWIGGSVDRWIGGSVDRAGRRAGRSLWLAVAVVGGRIAPGVPRHRRAVPRQPGLAGVAGLTRKDVFFINADREFREGKSENFLRPEDLSKIVHVHRERRTAPAYARLVPHGVIASEEWNCNIRRYVDNAPPPEPHDDPRKKIGTTDEHR